MSRSIIILNHNKLMKPFCLLFIIYFFVVFAKAQDSRAILFDKDWRFKKGSIINAEDPSYDDAGWRKLDLPHDWSIEDLTDTPSDSAVGPFSKKSAGKHATAWTVGGTAWYRKKFSLDKNSAGKKVYIRFDGVYMNSDVWINGHHLGNHRHGYTSFIYDLTAYLKRSGEKNVIAVEVKNEGDNSRWYSGSGIYRHVYLHVLNQTHIQNWGVAITTNNIFQNSADVNISTLINNRTSNLSLKAEVYSAEDKLVGSSSVDASNKAKAEISIAVKTPKFWDNEKPYLYQLKLSLIKNGIVVDIYKQSFGIRTIQFSSKDGFSLNGKSIKLKGGCIHHDNGPLGAAAIDRAEERKIELLKQNGYNAIRFSHNPYSPYLLDVCDRLGMLIVDEAFDMWNVAKSPDDYSKFFKENWKADLENMIIRDRNHPSIIMWSIGNEIPEIADTLGHETSKQLADFVRAIDNTRPVTNAIPIFVAFQPGKNWDMTANSFAALDVAGYNYANTFYEKDHQKFPERIMMATETFPPQGLENWTAVEKNPYVIGMLSWAAMDYLGESGIGLARVRNKKEKAPDFSTEFIGPHWPIFNSYTGELDLIGNKKVASYYLDVVWRRSLVEMVVHRPLAADMKEYTSYWGFPDEYKSWTFPGHENDTLQIRVFSRSEKVKLELNGRIIAEQTVKKGSITTTFEVRYQPGTLVAKGFIDGKEVGKSMLSTTGKPAAIRLVPDRKAIKADANDLSFVSVEVVDEKGNVVPYVDDLEINYELTGAGKIAGVGNGNPADLSSFQQNHKKVYGGRGLVIVQPAGKSGVITLKAAANGLAPAQLNITTQ